jgi:tetratricopeptide (TPR) repeat protein
VAGVNCATFSPDGRRLATASDDFTIKLWDTATGGEVFTLRGHTATVMSLAFSPDGNRIASGGLDHTARVWDATPLSPELLKAAEDRYQRKLIELRDLASAGDDGQRAEIHARNQRWGEAVTSYSRAIELHPTDAMNWFKRGLAHGKLGRTAQADADYSRALELDANGSRTFLGHSYRLMAFPLMGTGQLREAEKAFRAALRSFEKAAADTPTIANLWHGQSNTLKQLGRILRKEGRSAEAADAFRRALALTEQIGAEGRIKDLSPNWIIEHYTDLVYLLDIAGRGQEAMPALKKVLELAPNNAMIHNDLAWFLAMSTDARVRDPQRAVSLARRAVALAPREEVYWNTLGVACYRSGDWSAAIEALMRSMELLPDQSEGFNSCFLAMAHWQLGDKPQARSRYDKAVPWMEKNQPKDEELIRFRAEAAALLGVEAKKK